MILKEISTLDLFFLIAGPVLSILLIVIIAILIYKYCWKRNSREDQIYLLENDSSTRLSYTATEYDPNTLSYIKNDTHLFEKVKNEKLSLMKESRETAFIYFQFFVRSNPDKIFKSFEHLPMIGNQIDRNWFLVKQATLENNSEIIRFKLILINYIESKLSTVKHKTKKKDKLLDIAESMSLSSKEMEAFLNDFLITPKHPYILSFDKVDVNFEKNRILFMQDYSRDGSLRDLLYNSNPTDDISVKNKQINQQTIRGLTLKRIKEFGKQILSGLIYLKNTLFFSFDNLHSGNIILAYKKNICLLTGFENEFFFSKTQADNLAEKTLNKISKTYLIRTSSKKNDEIIIRKAESEYELKEIVSVLRFGQLILTMCFGYESLDELIPSEKILLKYFNLMSDRASVNQIKNLIDFIFFNRNVSENNEKLKKKFILPSFEQIYAHEFFNQVKVNQDVETVNLNPKQMQFLQYFTGKLKVKSRKNKRKLHKTTKDKEISLFNSDKLSPINETDREYQMNTNNNKSVGPSPPPPPPPASTLLLSNSVGRVPPAPPPPPQSPISSNDSTDRSALLSDIRGGLKLKKTITNDRSAPKI